MIVANVMNARRAMQFLSHTKELKEFSSKIIRNCSPIIAPTYMILTSI
jgi:hypothetical protein